MAAENRQIKDIAEEFFVTTTAHGWRHVVSGTRYSVKLAWLILTLLAFTVNVAHVTFLVKQYLQFPYEQVTQVEVTHVTFPSITVCNLQPISQSSTTELLEDTSSQFRRWTNTTRYFFEYLETVVNDSWTYDIWHDRMRGPRGYFENIGNETRIVGHQVDDFILSCSFGKNECGSKNFTIFDSPTYFNCYTYNGGNISSDKLIARATGPESGLSLIFYLESDNGDMLYDGPYYKFLNTANSAGVRVTIHAPDTRPSPIDFGFDIPPGYSSSLGINLLVYRRLGPPYGKCVPEDQTPPEARFLYSAHACMMLCQQEAVMSKCGCISASLPIPDLEVPLEYCGFYNETDPNVVFSRSECEAKITIEFSNNSEMRATCGCDAPCNEYTYKTDVTFSYWPIDFSQQSFYEKYVLKHEKYPNLKAYKNLNRFNISELIYHGLIRKNFARLNIYIKSLIVEESVQKESYTFFNLFSDIGGTFGLWIGMSILTWGEVFELIVHLSMSWIKTIQRRRRSSAPTTSQTELQAIQT